MERKSRQERFAEDKLTKAKAQLDELEQLGKAYMEFMFNPALWVTYILGVKHIDPQQREVLDKVGLLWKAKYYKWKGYDLTTEMKEALSKQGVSTRAGKGTGKDACNAWLIMWALDCWGPLGMKIPITAPKESQIIKEIVWPEISTWLDKRDDKTGEYLCKIRDKIVIQSEKIFLKGYEKTAFAFPKVASLQANDAEAAKTLDGLHNDFMMIIITEADGVRESVFTALETTMTGPVNIAVMAFNPTKNTGFAAGTHKDEVEKTKWFLVHQNAENSSLVTKESIENKRKKGVNSNYYRIYVLGEFPLDSADSIIKWKWLIDATQREFEEDENYPIMAGIDPAGEGSDKTIIAIRQKHKLIALEEITDSDKDTKGEKCLEVLYRYNVDDCIVLANGVGAELYLYLKKYFKKVKGVYEMNSPIDGRKYKNKRAEMWDDCAKAFEDGLLQIPYNPDLLGELNAPMWLREKQLLQVEAKERIKKFLKRSPDNADAFVATFAKGFDYAKLIGRREEALRKKKSNEPSSSWMAA